MLLGLGLLLVIEYRVSYVLHLYNSDFLWADQERFFTVGFAAHLTSKVLVTEVFCCEDHHHDVWPLVPWRSDTR